MELLHVKVTKCKADVCGGPAEVQEFISGQSAPMISDLLHFPDSSLFFTVMGDLSHSRDLRGGSRPKLFKGERWGSLVGASVNSAPCVCVANEGKGVRGVAGRAGEP